MPPRLTVLCGRVLEASTKVPPAAGPSLERLETPLPGILIPMEETAAVVRVAVPTNPGRYVVEIRCREPGPLDASRPADAIVELTVVPSEDPVTGCCAVTRSLETALGEADRALRIARRLRRCHRRLVRILQTAHQAEAPRQLSTCLCHVLSRRQTAFNKALLQATHQAVECCTLLDHALSAGGGGANSEPLQVVTAHAIEKAVVQGKVEEIQNLFQQLLQELASTWRTTMPS